MNSPYADMSDVCHLFLSGKLFMKKQNILLATVAAACLLSGCANSLNSVQEAELKGYQSKGLEVKEKNPGTGAALGILPGGGSFYTRSYGVGVANLLLWPLSVCWDPINGYNGAQSINYYATKASVTKKLRAEMSVLDTQLQTKTITSDEYVTKKNALESKYSSDL
jgi:hypothetical protein